MTLARWATAQGAASGAGNAERRSGRAREAAPLRGKALGSGDRPERARGGSRGRAGSSVAAPGAEVAGSATDRKPGRTRRRPGRLLAAASRNRDAVVHPLQARAVRDWVTSRAVARRWR